MSYQFCDQDIDIYFDLEPPDGCDVRECGDEARISQEAQIQAHSTKKGRTSNYVFKSPLRLFIKVVLGIEGPEFLRKQVRAIAKEKNLQTFPKLVCFCQRQGIRKQITQIWSREAQNFLITKRRAVTESSYLELQRWTNRMTSALALNDWAELVEMYWGDKVRHKDKLNNCINQIEKINSYEY